MFCLAREPKERKVKRGKAENGNGKEEQGREKKGLGKCVKGIREAYQTSPH